MQKSSLSSAGIIFWDTSSNCLSQSSESYFDSREQTLWNKPLLFLPCSLKKAIASLR